MIKRIRIRDFKSIRDVDLQLDPVTVLLGRSGTGKSNLVQAIRFLRNYLLNPDQAVSHESGWERIIPVWERAPKMSIDVSFSVPGEDREYDYRLVFGAPPHGSGQLLMVETLRLGAETVFSRSRSPTNFQWNWQTSPKTAPMPPFADYSMLGSFPSMQQVVFAYAALSTGIGYYHFAASTLVSGGSVQPSFHAIPGLSDNAANYRDVIRAITQDFHHPNIRKSLLASVRAVNPSIESIELDSLTSPQRAIIGHKAGDLVFALSLEQESDGLRRFYAHLLALYQTPAKLTLVFEEPENAIFPGALSLLADEFKAAPREDRGQVILTTHSPGLLDSFDVDSVRVVEMRDGATVVGLVSKEQRQAVKERLLSTGELLTVDRARVDEERQAPQPA